MNKTVNINLAGFFYHIDEDAYQKLQNYLRAIKRSFAGSAGEDEIIADIEARIAELFSEKMQSDKQVIGMTTVDEVIKIMGQPEDYMVDEDIFEDEPKRKSSSKSSSTSSSKKLFRDPDNKYVGGVASGFAHYTGIDALWIRLALVLLVFFGVGTPILIYISLWIFVPEAKTTAEKLQMKGEPINISNIEKKIKEGIDDVTETVKNVDYEKHGKKAKNGISSFFEGLGNVFMTLLKIFGKFIGVILIITGICSLIGLLIGFVSLGSIDIFNFPFGDESIFNYFGNDSGIPIWLASLFGFLAIGIPFFLLIYLGFRILVKNFKSMSNYAKFSLLGLWIVSIMVLTIFGVKQVATFKEKASVVTTEELM
ncbi:MAG: PspC domain-containing protein, partial [Flavobacteriaceae bacterium]|nr:PspC domain-containing protein [Flavobacteriaceae bacterium]